MLRTRNRRRISVSSNGESSGLTSLENGFEISAENIEDENEDEEEEVAGLLQDDGPEVEKPKRTKTRRMPFSFDVLRRADSVHKTVLDAQAEDEASSDETAKDFREKILMEVEIVKEATNWIRKIDSEKEILLGIKIICVKRRIESRRKLLKAQAEHDAAKDEMQRILLDQYESQLPSVVAKAERILDRAEHVLKTQTKETEFFSFGDHGAHRIAKAVRRTRTIKSMELPKNEIGPKGLRSLAIVLCKCRRLQKLDLRGNPLYQGGVKSLGPILKRCEGLYELNLNSCNLGHEGIDLLVKSAHKHSNLKKIYLRNNQIGETGAELVATWILKENLILEELDLATNKIGANQGLEALARASSSAPRLKMLDISFNNLKTALRTPEKRNLLLSLRKESVKGIW